MSDRHMHITGFLYDDERIIERFITAARSLGFFQEVQPVNLAASAGRIRAVTFFSKDRDGVSDELEMPEVASKLSGILAYDTVIVSAWDGPYGEGSPFVREREHAWVVKGSGRCVPGEMVSGARELMR